jgi:hypothetical protein
MKYRTTREIADLVGVEEWQVRRLFEAGVLPEPGRFGGKRAIPRKNVPVIVDALRERGYLRHPQAEITAR